MVASSILIVLSGCSSSKPVDEDQIKTDIISDTYNISSGWIQSRERADNTEQYLPYTIVDLSIEKRDTRKEEGWDTIWFDFTATNGIHNYSGSAYAEYKLYSEGGWILENCMPKEYISSPASEPRFEEFAATLDSITNPRYFPESLDEDKFILEDCYLDEEDVPKEYVDDSIFPSNTPVAVYKYTGKAGFADDLFTQAENLYYVLGYAPDSSYDYASGWYFDSIALSSDSKEPEGKNEWRIYKSQSDSEYSDSGLIALQISDGSVAAIQLAFPVNGTYYIVYESSSVTNETVEGSDTALHISGRAKSSFSDPEWGDADPVQFSFVVDGAYISADNYPSVNWWYRSYPDAELIDIYAPDKMPATAEWIGKYIKSTSVISDSVSGSLPE